MTRSDLASPGSERAFDFINPVLLAAGGLLFLSFGHTEMAGSDMWWHLAAGRELLQTGSPWMVDDWSYSAHGGDWLNHEWLADIVYYCWVSAFGLTSLVYWKWLVVVTTFLLLQVSLYKQTGNTFAALIGASIAAAIAAPFIDVRPHLYTLLLFCLLIYLLLERQPTRWLLASLFVVWVNLHGGFFFGLMALGILIFPWRQFSLDAFRVALVTGLICVAASVFNPSGFKTFLYPLIYAFDSSSPYRELGEWHDPFRAGGIRSPLFFYFMWTPLLALLYALPAVRKTAGVPWEGMVLTALTLAMALTSRRFIPIFAISLSLMLAPLLALLFRQVRLRALQYVLAITALLFACLRLLPYPLQSAPAFHYLTAQYSYPDDMISFMQANDFHGNVYALYNWGGYIHWRTDGELKVFIDGRADTVFDAKTYFHYLGVLSGKPGWISAIESSGADFVIWPYERRGGQKKLQELLATGRWRALYQDSVSWAAARKGVELPATPQFAQPSPISELSRAMVALRSGNAQGALTSAQLVRAEIPWQKQACQLEIDLLRGVGEFKAAEDTLWDCLSYFPTRMLR
ncbi:MAG: hypothetical protein P8L70_13150 [Halioglobus sp.]|nr:hypothetical protein [Halioglobus sp.]